MLGSPAYRQFDGRPAKRQDPSGPDASCLANPWCLAQHHITLPSPPRWNVKAGGWFSGGDVFTVEADSAVFKLNVC